MIKTYDEALEKLNNLRTRLFVYATDENLSEINECVRELDAIAKVFIYEKRNKPTLEEVIKKWEAKNYSFIKLENENMITITNKAGHGIIIDLNDETFTVTKWFNINLLPLLIETLERVKVLGWFDE